MDALKKLFPFSFKERTTKQLILSLLIYVLAYIVAALVYKVLDIIPFLGDFLSWAFGKVAELYILGGIVLVLLRHFKVVD